MSLLVTTVSHQLAFPPSRSLASDSLSVCPSESLKLSRCHVLTLPTPRCPLALSRFERSRQFHVVFACPATIKINIMTCGFVSKDPCQHESQKRGAVLSVPHLTSTTDYVPLDAPAQETLHIGTNSAAAAPKTEVGNQLTKHRLATRCVHHVSKRLASSVAYHFRSSWSPEKCCHNTLLHECEIRSLNASLPQCTCYTCHSKCHLRAQFLKYSSEVSSG